MKTLAFALLAFLPVAAAAEGLSLEQCAGAIRARFRDGVYQGYTDQSLDPKSRVCRVRIETTKGRIAVKFLTLSANGTVTTERTMLTQGGQNFQCTGRKDTPIIVTRKSNGREGYVRALQVFDETINIISNEYWKNQDKLIPLTSQCRIQMRIGD
ncbi:MAG TPA: hypothetical protein VFV50_16710 [Bdellovibrionales bacterium]|nr:hypothetical protein [Bdellovibrionales bacterium]